MGLLDMELAQLVDGHPRAPRHDDVGHLEPAVGQGGSRDGRAEAMRHDRQRLVGLEIE